MGYRERQPIELDMICYLEIILFKSYRLNFLFGAVLEGYTGSLSTEEDPNEDEVTNDNGIDNSTPAIDGLCGNLVTLPCAAKPGQELDPGQLPDRVLDSKSNLTVDFRFARQQPSNLAETDETPSRSRFFLPWVKIEQMTG